MHFLSERSGTRVSKQFPGEVVPIVVGSKVPTWLKVTTKACALMPSSPQGVYTIVLVSAQTRPRRAFWWSRRSRRSFVSLASELFQRRKPMDSAGTSLATSLHSCLLPPWVRDQFVITKSTMRQV